MFLTQTTQASRAWFRPFDHHGKDSGSTDQETGSGKARRRPTFFLSVSLGLDAVGFLLAPLSLVAKIDQTVLGWAALATFACAMIFACLYFADLRRSYPDKSHHIGSNLALFDGLLVVGLSYWLDTSASPIVLTMSDSMTLALGVLLVALVPIGVAAFGLLHSSTHRKPPSRLPPPGWYPNPLAPGQRYWDGVRWTDNIAPWSHG